MMILIDLNFIVYYYFWYLFWFQLWLHLISNVIWLFISIKVIFFYTGLNWTDSFIAAYDLKNYRDFETIISNKIETFENLDNKIGFYVSIIRGFFWIIINRLI